MDVNQAILLNTDGSELWAFLFSIDDNRSAKIIGSPVETGVTIFDNKVIQPRTVSLRGLLPMAHNGDFENWTPEKCLSDLKKAFENRTYETYTVVTKTETITNLVVENLQYTNTSEKFDAVDVSVSLKELMLVTQKYKQVNPIEKPKSRDDGSTIASGLKSIGSTVISGGTAGSIWGSSGMNLINMLR